MTRRRAYFVSQCGERYVTPEFNDGREDSPQHKSADVYDPTWEEILTLFENCKSYPDFVKASVRAHGFYSSGRNGIKEINPCHRLNWNETPPLSDESFWFYEVPSSSKYADSHQIEANADDVKVLIEKGETNTFLKVGGYYHDDPALDHDSPFSFKEVDDLTALAHIFCHDNWAYRTGFIYKGVAFINQLSGGGEWWTLVKHEDGTWEAVDSVSFRLLVKRGEFVTYMKHLLTKGMSRKQ